MSIVSFVLDCTPWEVEVLLTGLVLGVCLGFVGGLLFAEYARLPSADSIIESLRATWRP